MLLGWDYVIQGFRACMSCGHHEDCGQVHVECAFVPFMASSDRASLQYVLSFCAGAMWDDLFPSESDQSFPFHQICSSMFERGDRFNI